MAASLGMFTLYAIIYKVLISLSPSKEQILFEQQNYPVTAEQIATPDYQYQKELSARKCLPEERAEFIVIQGYESIMNC